jgi:hypothetical protein
MATRSVLVPRQVYSTDNSPTSSPVIIDYFEMVTRPQELKRIDDKVFKALVLWEKYSDNHEVILFA